MEKWPVLHACCKEIIKIPWKHCRQNNPLTGQSASNNFYVNHTVLCCRAAILDGCHFYEVLVNTLPWRFSIFHQYCVCDTFTVEPQFNEGPRDWQSLFILTRFCYIGVLFHIYFSVIGVKKIVHYINYFVQSARVPPYLLTSYSEHRPAQRDSAQWDSGPMRGAIPFQSHP